MTACAGSEAMFADLGHFSYAAFQVSVTFLQSVFWPQRSQCYILIRILSACQIAFTLLVYPALILAYMGQAAYLSQHHDNANHIGFYISVPGISLLFIPKKSQYPICI